MTLKTYDRLQSHQLNELIALNQHCLDLLEDENYENLLSLFQQRDQLTQSFIKNMEGSDNENIIKQLNAFDELIVTKVIQKKKACADSLSVFYRQNNANKQYIGTQKSLLNSTLE